MRESRTYGSVRGAPSNGRPYRDPACAGMTGRVAAGTTRRFVYSGAGPNRAKRRLSTDARNGSGNIH